MNDSIKWDLPVGSHRTPRAKRYREFVVTTTKVGRTRCSTPPEVSRRGRGLRLGAGVCPAHYFGRFRPAGDGVVRGDRARVVVAQGKRLVGARRGVGLSVGVVSPARGGAVEGDRAAVGSAGGQGLEGARRRRSPAVAVAAPA